MAIVEKNLRIESTAEIAFNDPARVSFEQALMDFFINVPVNEFNLEYKLDKTYVYSFDFIDGRHWEQDVTFDKINDELVNFDKIHGAWRSTSEAVLHRPVRASVGAFLAATNFSIKKISVKILRT